MDLDGAADQLYGLDPDEFMPARTALVAQARAAKYRPLASAIGGLRKPTRSAWLVNLLARETPDRLRLLDELAQRMASAHHGLDVTSLRTLGAERQRLVAELTRAAVVAGEARGYRATEAVRTEVDQTLNAAIADAGVRAEVLAGRVVKAHVYSGFGFPMAAAPAPEPASSSPASEPVPLPSESQPDADHRAADLARRRAQEAVDAATAALAEARAAVEAAENADAEARERLDRAAVEVADLRAELRAAEATELVAREAANTAADELHEARGVVQQAEQALTDATRARAAADYRASGS